MNHLKQSAFRELGKLMLTTKKSATYASPVPAKKPIKYALGNGPI